MSDAIKELIGKAYEKDAAGFQTAFNSIMTDKLSDAISAKYDSMFTPQTEAEELEIDNEDLQDEQEDNIQPESE